MNATRLVRPAARSLDDPIWTTPVEIGTPVHLPPPVIVGGTIMNPNLHSQPTLNPVVGTSVDPLLSPVSCAVAVPVVRNAPIIAGEPQFRPLPFFPPPSWPPRTNRLHEQRQQQQQQQQRQEPQQQQTQPLLRQSNRVSSGYQSRREEREEMVFSAADAGIAEAERTTATATAVDEAVTTAQIVGWRPHPANTSFEYPPPTPLFARERRRPSRRQPAVLDQSQEQATESEQDETASGTNSLSFSHSYAPTPDDPNSEDYIGIFRFVNTAHDLGWSVSNQNAVDRKQHLDQQNRQLRNTSRDEPRSLSLKPPSAAVAENNVHVMQQICTSFEKKRNKTIL